MRISTDGINLIKKWESFRSNTYQDSVGVWTIGYGTTKGINANTHSITKEEATKLLKDDIIKFETEIHRLNLNLRQCQYDAVVSFCYNLGTPNFKSSTAYNLMKNNPDDKRIADSWITWRNAGGNYLRGLLRRRLDEVLNYYSW
jgi:lysozyme